jgi:hypothetical protein
MDEKEFKRFEALLKHWIEHSKEHSEEYTAWGATANNNGMLSVYSHLTAASKNVALSGRELRLALKQLEKYKRPGSNFT